MNVEGLYGDRLARLFAKTDGPYPVNVKSINRGTFAATRVSCDDLSAQRIDPAPPEEAFALCLSLKRQRAEMWVDF